MQKLLSPYIFVEIVNSVLLSISLDTLHLNLRCKSDSFLGVTVWRTVIKSEEFLYS